VIEPIQHADEADLAEHAGPVDDAIEQGFPSSDPLRDNRDADVADLFEQKLSVSGHDDGHPPAAGRAAAEPVTRPVLRAAWQSDPFKTRPSFVEDMASLNKPYRPNS
jgi:hypothetical protein